MKQIIQDLKTGETILEEVPCPAIQKGHVLIKTHRSLVSLGTEKMLVEFGKANWIEKARQQPEKVRQVLNKVKTDGLKPTLDAVFRKLGEPLPLGYSNAGEVIEVAPDVTDFKIGDRVVSNGHHAEFVCVPKNLVARIPDNVSYDEASFTVVGAIGLQGIRLVNPTFGETIVVFGLGLIGLLTVQLLKASGCNVIGFDVDPAKVKLASSFGVQSFQVNENVDTVNLVLQQTNEVGADGVIITASTKSNDLIAQAAQMSRKRGRIVLVGVIGLDLQRSDFYEKELTFQVSCSYGPGRYDPEYEQKGLDYPLSFVRWTENRNFIAVLNAIASDLIDVKQLISQVIDLDNYNDIYGNLSDKSIIASILKYTESNVSASSTIQLQSVKFDAGKERIAIIGAGNFTSAMILPSLYDLKANINVICSSKGLTSTTLAKKYKIPYSSTNVTDVVRSVENNTVVITTRHNSHASLVLSALQNGKHVFVEKPLALTLDEIDEIEKAYSGGTSILAVGFNRRFSPFVTEAIKLTGGKENPLNVIVNVNAGFIPDSHWTQDMSIGGGRIIGEACHFIDLITALTGSLVKEVLMNPFGINPSDNVDSVTIILKYANGSNGVINYFSNGAKSYPKERIEIHASGKSIVIDNFRKSTYFGYGSSGMSKTQDKGHYNQFKAFLNSIRTGHPYPLTITEIINTSKVAILAIESMKTNSWVQVQ